MSKENLGNSFYCATSKGRVTRVINGVKMVPERKWIDLTEDEIEDLTSVMFEEPSNEEVIAFALRVQAKLKEKNND